MRSGLKASALLCIILWISGNLISCSENETTSQECKLTKMVITDGGLQMTFNLTYSDNGVLSTGNLIQSSNGTSTKYVFSISDEGLITNYTDNATGELIKEYFYNADNQLTEELTYIDNEPAYKDTYSYNSSGQPSQKKTYILGDLSTLWYTWTFHYDNTSTKNTASAEVYNNVGGYLAYTNTYEYDKKKNPGFPFFNSTTNNVTHGTMKIHSMNITLATDVSYQYNSQGYPVKATFDNETQGGTNKIVVYTFDYDCH